MTNEAQNLFTQFAKTGSINYDELHEKQSFQNIDAGKYRHEFSDGSAIVCDYRRGCMNLGIHAKKLNTKAVKTCLLYTSPSPRDRQKSRMPSSA